VRRLALTQLIPSRRPVAAAIVIAVMLAVACLPASAAGMTSAVSVTVGPPQPSTVMRLTITPNPVGCREPGAGSRKPDVGDGNWWIAPINSLPFTTTHTWASAGTYTVLARGYVTCDGEVTRAVTVGSAPEPAALVSTGVSPLDAWALEGDETRLDVLEAGPWVPSDEPMFAPQATVPLTVDLTGTGSGTVTSSPGGLVCAGTDGQTCSAGFTAGTSVTLSATPDAGSTFAGWGGACSGTGACTVPLASARLVVAAFTVPPPWVTQYYHTDALGSVRAVTDTAGAVVRTHDYHPFGEGVGMAAGTDPVRFTGKPRDVETGLDYFGARYYAQGAGRFTTVDPVYTWQENLVDPERWNRYAYVRNNPGRYVDPDGRILWPVVAVAAAAGILTPINANAPNPGDSTFPSDSTGEAIGNAAAAENGSGLVDRGHEKDLDTGPEIRSVGGGRRSGGGRDDRDHPAQ
jgi:RHS repeat-associated protein